MLPGSCGGPLPPPTPCGSKSAVAAGAGDAGRLRLVGAS